MAEKYVSRCKVDLVYMSQMLWRYARGAYYSRSRWKGDNWRDGVASVPEGDGTRLGGSYLAALVVIIVP